MLIACADCPTFYFLLLVTTFAHQQHLQQNSFLHSYSHFGWLSSFSCFVPSQQQFICCSMIFSRLAYSSLTLREANIKLTFQTKIEKKLKIMIRITKSHVINVVIQRYAPFLHHLASFLFYLFLCPFSLVF